MSRIPSPFDYGSRSNSSKIPFSEPPSYSNYTRHFALLFAPHATFPFVEDLRQTFVSAVPSSASSLGRNS